MEGPMTPMTREELVRELNRTNEHSKKGDDLLEEITGLYCAAFKDLEPDLDPENVASVAAVRKFLGPPQSGTISIIVNGIEKKVASADKIEYSHILEMAGYSKERHLSVTFSIPVRQPYQGILFFGESIELFEGTVFNAVDTSNA